LKIIGSILLFAIIIGCSNKNENIASKEFLTEINNWDLNRAESLKKETGWLNLVGLFWLNDGINTFGSGEENDIVFPENSPAHIGKFLKVDSVITFFSDKHAQVFNDGKKVESILMNDDVSGNPTILENSSLRWFIIKRGNKYGIRLRDLKAEALEKFDGISRFPINENWKIEAKFIPYNSHKKIMIPTILGTFEENISPGKLEFSIDNKSFTLIPTGSIKRLFIVFADLTSGEETYGAGRFLYADGPDSNNIVILDFNKSYNPPCAFSKYATCPLPPDENKLKIRITAGEKNYGNIY